MGTAAVGVCRYAYGPAYAYIRTPTVRGEECEWVHVGSGRGAGQV
jgi:hypothetical protein